MAAPVAPTIQAINRSAGTIRVRWGVNEDAGDYTVYRDETAHPTTELGDTAETHLDDLTVTPGTDYYYRVKANNDDGSSGYSNEIHLTALDPATGNTTLSRAADIARRL